MLGALSKITMGVVMIRMKIFLLCVLVLLATGSAFAFVSAPGGSAKKLPPRPPSKIHVGDNTPVFQGKDMNGQAFDLDVIVGKKPIMLVFWSTWCKDCKRKLADINEIAKKYGQDDIFFVGINVGMNDSVEKALAYIEENEITYPNIFDETGALSEKYQLNKVFSLILIDKNGIMKMKLNRVPIVDDMTLKMLNASVHFAQDKPVEVNERVEK